jgi:hypothetical protein
LNSPPIPSACTICKEKNAPHRSVLSESQMSEYYRTLWFKERRLTGPLYEYICARCATHTIDTVVHCDSQSSAWTLPQLTCCSILSIEYELSGEPCLAAWIITCRKHTESSALSRPWWDRNLRGDKLLAWQWQGRAKEGAS